MLITNLPRVDGRASTRLAWAHQWLVWLMLILTVARVTIFVRRRDTADFAVVDVSALLGIVIVGVLAFAILLHPRALRTLKEAARSSSKWLIAYFILCMVSAAWSLHPAYTGFRAAEVAVILFAGMVLMARYADFAQAEKVLLGFLLLTTVLGFLMCAKGGFSLAALHTNLYTVMSGIGFIYCIGERFRATARRRRLLNGFAVVFFGFIVVGTSAGSNIAVLGAFLVVLSLVGVGRVIIIPALLLWLVIFFALGSVEELVMQTLFPGKSMEQVTSMHGREFLWQTYINLLWENSLHGYGFGVIARYGAEFGINSTTNMHNGYLEVLLGTGIIGALLFLLWLLRLGLELRVAYRTRRPGAIGIIGAFVMLLANNMSKSIVGGAFDASFAAAVVLIGFAFFHVYRPCGARRRHVRMQRPRLYPHPHPPRPGHDKVHARTFCAQPLRR